MVKAHVSILYSPQEPKAELTATKLRDYLD